MTKDERDLAIARLDPTDFNSTAKMFQLMDEYCTTLENTIDSLNSDVGSLEDDVHHLEIVLGGYR